MPVVASSWHSLKTLPTEAPDSRRPFDCPAPPRIGQRNWHANAHESETLLLCNAGKHHDKFDRERGQQEAPSTHSLS